MNWNKPKFDDFIAIMYVIFLPMVMHMHIKLKNTFGNWPITDRGSLLIVLLVRGDDKPQHPKPEDRHRHIGTKSHADEAASRLHRQKTRQFADCWHPSASCTCENTADQHLLPNINQKLVDLLPNSTNYSRCNSTLNWLSFSTNCTTTPRDTLAVCGKRLKSTMCILCVLLCLHCTIFNQAFGCHTPIKRVVLYRKIDKQNIARKAKDQNFQQ